VVPIDAETMNVDVHKDHTRIQLNKGSKDGIQHGQKGWVLDENGDPLPDGEVVIIIVRSGVSIAKTSLKRAVVNKYRQVRIDPTIVP